MNWLKNIKEWLSETRTRLKLKSPVYFKKIRNAALSIGASAIAVIAVNSTLNLNLDPTFINIVSYVIAVCAAIAGTANLTKEDKKEEEL